MGEPRFYGQAAALMMLAGLAGIVGALWLAIQGDWAAAGAALLVVLLAAGGLMVLGERAQRHVTVIRGPENVEPWTSKKPDDDREARDKLRLPS